MKCGLTFSHINIIMISGSVSPAATPQPRNVGFDEEGEPRNYIRLALNKRMRRGAIKSIKCGTRTVTEGVCVCAVCVRDNMPLTPRISKQSFPLLESLFCVSENFLEGPTRRKAFWVRGDNTSPQQISAVMQSEKSRAVQYHRDMPRRMRRYLREKRFRGKECRDSS